MGSGEELRGQEYCQVVESTEGGGGGGDGAKDKCGQADCQGVESTERGDGGGGGGGGGGELKRPGTLSRC